MKIKSEKKFGKNFKYRWSSHQPVINTILELLNPKLIIELGVGTYSTPLLLNSNAIKTIHIDNDSGWIDLVKKENNISIKNDFRTHILDNNINLKIPLKDLSQNQKSRIANYYNELLKEINEINYRPSVIFTDGFTCCRKLSIDILTKSVDVMIYHDAEHPELYGYDNLDTSINDSYEQYILQTATSWTGFFIRKGLIDTDTLNSTMDKYVKQYIENLDISADGFNFLQIST